MFRMSSLSLVSIKPSEKPGKKLVATFDREDRKKRVHFGAAGMDDYTKTHDKEQRARYIERHRANENWSDPTSPGALSRFILWGESVSLVRNIAAFKKRFNL